VCGIPATIEAEVPLPAGTHPEDDVGNEMTRGGERQRNEPEVKRGAEAKEYEEAEAGKPQTRMRFAYVDHSSCSGHGIWQKSAAPGRRAAGSIDRPLRRRYDGQ
jgi:hypothetical protein